MKYTLQHKGDLLRQLPSKTVLWLTDSLNMEAFLTKGSTKKQIMPDILQTFKAARAVGLKILPVQVSREDYRLQAADHGTRFFDPDDWAIDFESFRSLNGRKEWEASIDIYAHFSNTKTKRFYSYGKSPETEGTGKHPPNRPGYSGHEEDSGHGDAGYPYSTSMAHSIVLADTLTSSLQKQNVFGRTLSEASFVRTGCYKA